MSGIFEELEMFDEGDKVVTRQAIAAATKRFNDNFGGFLRQASTEKEFESRLALVNTDIDNMVADVVIEYGGDAEKIAAAVKETVKTAFTPTNFSNDDFPPCENCGGHGCEECTNDPDGSNDDGPSTKNAEAEMPDTLYKGASERPEHLKAQDEIQLAEEHSQVNPWLKKQIQDEDQEDGGNLRNKEAASDKCEACDCEPCECDKHEDKTANVEDSQPVSKQVPLAEKEGYGGNIEEKLEKAPSAVGKGEGDHKEAAAHTVEEKDDKFVVVEDGGKEAAGPFDSQEEAYARANELNDLENLEDEDTHKESGEGVSLTITMAKALALKEAAARGEKRNFFSKDEWVNEGDTVTEDGEKKKVEDIAQHGNQKVVELNDGSVEDIDDVHVAATTETGDKTEKRESLPTGDESALDGPSPKMDKKQWKPNATNPDGNLKPIETEDKNSPHPTRQMDIKQKPDYQQDTFENLKKYDNNVWEREQLPTATKDEAGFEGTRNIDQPSKAAETFPDKGQTNPVTREALAGNEKIAIFEDERDILEKNVPEDYAPTREGIMSELANLKQRLIDFGDSPEEAEKEIRDLVMGMWRSEQSPEDLESIGIQQMRPEHDAPVEDLEEPSIEEEVEIEESPENIEKIIERGDDDEDRVDVIHDHEEDEEDEDPLGFDDPEKLEEDEEEELPFDEELSDEELDRLLEEEESKYDDDDLFL